MDDVTDQQVYEATNTDTDFVKTFELNNDDIQPATSYKFSVKLVAPKKEVTTENKLTKILNMESEKVEILCTTKPPTPTGKSCFHLSRKIIFAI